MLINYLIITLTQNIDFSKIEKSLVWAILAPNGAKRMLDSDSSCPKCQTCTLQWQIWIRSCWPKPNFGDVLSYFRTVFQCNITWNLNNVEFHKCWWLFWTLSNLLELDLYFQNFTWLFELLLEFCCSWKFECLLESK